MEPDVCSYLCIRRVNLTEVSVFIREAFGRGGEGRGGFSSRTFLT